MRREIFIFPLIILIMVVPGIIITVPIEWSCRMGMIAEILLPDKKTTKIRIIGNAIFTCFFTYGVIVNRSIYAFILLAFCIIPLAIDLGRIWRMKRRDNNSTPKHIHG